MHFKGSDFVSGQHVNGFGLRFEAQADGWLYADYAFDRLKQGPPGIIHGGALAAVIDEAMTAAVFGAGYVGFTVNLNINYRAAVLVGQRVSIQARIEQVDGRKIRLNAQILLPDGSPAVEASGLFLKDPAAASAEN